MAEMTYQGAYDLLINQIYAPVFFEKLAADYGINPNSEDEAREFLALAGKLQQLDEAQQTKKANDRKSFVSQASQSLDSVLHGAGLPVASDVKNASEIKEAAAQLAQVPHIRDAALLYQDCVRQLTAQQ